MRRSAESEPSAVSLCLELPAQHQRTWKHGSVTDARGDLPRPVWVPMTPWSTASLFANADFPWWIAGGFAIELAVGEPFRIHGDLDVLVLRRDQRRATELLAGWDLYMADPPGQGTLRPWYRGVELPDRVHDVWCRRSAEAPWSLQLMFDESDGDTWVSRRDQRVRRQIDLLGQVSPDGIPFLAPEVQLYYKAKSVREKDRLDFERVHPLLSDAQRAWLVEALELVHPGHEWIGRLTR